MTAKESRLRSRLGDRGLRISHRHPLKHPCSLDVFRLPWVVWKQGEYSDKLTDGTVLAQFETLEAIDKAYPAKTPQSSVLEQIDSTTPEYRFNFLTTAEEAHDIQWLFSLAIGEATEKMLADPSGTWEQRMVYLQNLRDKIVAGQVGL